MESSLGLLQNSTNSWKNSIDGVTVNILTNSWKNSIDGVIVNILILSVVGHGVNTIKLVFAASQ